MARTKPEHPPVHRTDLLPSNLTVAKETAVLALLQAYRRGAVLLSREQWRLLFETGRFDKTFDEDKVTFAAIIGAANRVQMARWQVVGQLQGWISNRANEFRDAVNHSSLPPDTKHMLHTINVLGAWFRRGDVVMKETGEVIPDAVRRLARTIMRHCMARHRKPSLSRISMRLDHRAGNIAQPVKATQGGAVGWWVNLSTLEKGRKIAVPLLTYAYHDARPGRVTNGIQVNERDGRLTFGVVIDTGAVCATSRADYNGHGVLALDFGLSTLFATSDGQLLGQGWLKRLKRYDALISMIAASQQRAGRKPRDSRRYRALVEDVRGFLRTEVGRVLNRLVEQGKPRELVLERLDFRHSDLSKRLNAILRNCGRKVIQDKLRDLEEWFGITFTEVNAAYTSQTCSCCGYVDKRNRRNQKTFVCLWCGHELHADLNAAANIEARRARSIGWLFQGKAAILVDLVREFNERRVRAFGPCRSGSRGAPADPRSANPYFGGTLLAVVRSAERREASVKSSEAQALVAA
ncbi:transposase [Azospirillum sp. B21]|uniref:RNA-guided endonuclease InsQ/TnpB family protein n=1 Tax=Azospirillum sp. B21 TaxID=2607496 RepID=UPI0011ED33AD|nr:zinc ribbon domain-containing protein [Azospirillum sp. B21]KAA0577938.1 transposase [Azospirillum sp. B21]